MCFFLFELFQLRFRFLNPLFDGLDGLCQILRRINAVSGQGLGDLHLQLCELFLVLVKFKVKFFLHGTVPGYPALEQVLYLFFLRCAAHGFEDFPYNLADHSVHLFRLVGGLPITWAELAALVVAGILDLVHMHPASVKGRSFSIRLFANFLLVSSIKKTTTLHRG